VTTAGLQQLDAKVDARFARVDTQILQFEARVDARFIQVDAWFAQMDARPLTLDQNVDGGFAAVRHEMALQVRWLVESS
jgi:hypothetical protein